MGDKKDHIVNIHFVLKIDDDDMSVMDIDSQYHKHIFSVMSFIEKKANKYNLDFLQFGHVYEEELKEIDRPNCELRTMCDLRALGFY